MPPPSGSPEAIIARTILEGFGRHYWLFRETSARAKARWQAADWPAVIAASRERIDMYDARVLEAVAAVTERFGQVAKDESRWPAIKRAYIALLHEHFQPELAETFFNSVARRVLDKRYYRHEYIFSRPAVSTEHLDGDEPTYRSYYPETHDLTSTFRQALKDLRFSLPFQDLERDLTYVQRAIDEHFPGGWERRSNFQVHVLGSPFFRNKAAFLVGRVVNGNATFPFVVPLRQDDERRIVVDTILLHARDLGRLFSLARSYFFVEMSVPSAYVAFLETVVPSKSKAELYTMLGLQKQGKTLFFRDLEHHLKHSTDMFVLAEGTKGMVMVVFTLPSYPYVFKVIRDWFAPPKDVDAELVRERYRYVKLHDRVGRMSDTLEYADVAFPVDRMDPALVAELERLAPSAIEREGERLVLRHFYIERRLIPLDVLLATADPARARETIADYGAAIKELAAADIFPGDLLLKNFGMNRYGRVVFYDYDELSDLEACNFRTMPKPRDDEDELRAEPFFSVGPRDVFPEQFPQFLFPAGPLRETFLELHGDIATAAFWNQQKERLAKGVVDDLFAYGQAVRFCNRFGAGPSR